MEFYGINAYFIKQYIEFKRNLGYAFKNDYTYGMFDRFTIENGATTIGLTKELSEIWAQKRPNESDVTLYKRVNDIINFSVYINHLGYNSYIPRQMKCYQTTFIPYIFSQDKLKSFFNSCDAIEVCKYSTMKYILPVIFRVIYGCGLRANEALSLKCGDINLNDKYIIIREPKNGRDRMLPLSDWLRYIEKGPRSFSSKVPLCYTKVCHFKHSSINVLENLSKLFCVFKSIAWAFHVQKS